MEPLVLRTLRFASRKVRNCAEGALKVPANAGIAGNVGIEWHREHGRKRRKGSQG